MEVEEIRDTLFEVAMLRMPRFTYPTEDDPTGGTPPGRKIERLESYLLEVAHARGQAEEARLWAESGVKDLLHEWNGLDGWQEQFGSAEKAARATQPQVKEAKRLIRPDLYDSINEGEFLASELKKQIKRLEKDEDVASRAYTLISGT